MKVCVVGAGLFGCTAAVYASRAGHDVHLYDKSSSIMQAASMCTQLRLHNGAHYPRSSDTGKQCRAGLKSFWHEYADAIVTPDRRGGATSVYAIAKEGSKVTPHEYLSFLNANDLFHDPSITSPLLNADAVSLVVGVQESLIDYAALKCIVAAKLIDAEVKMHFGQPACPSMRSEYDAIIVACYAGQNSALQALGAPLTPIQYEVVEKPLVRLPDAYRGHGAVVMDGPFCCLDPLGTGDMHLMGHVEHAIWHRNTGLEPEIPDELAGYLDRGIVGDPEHSRFAMMQADGVEYFPCLADAEHVGSMYTVRAVLPDKEASDARPTLVERLDEQVIRIFSGKLGTACTAAMDAVFNLERQVA